MSYWLLAEHPSGNPPELTVSGPDVIFYSSGVRLRDTFNKAMLWVWVFS